MQHQRSKPPHLLELRHAMTPVIQTHFVASLDQAGTNGGCNSIALTLIGTREKIK
jgi:hypothetical protein